MDFSLMSLETFKKSIGPYGLPVAQVSHWKSVRNFGMAACNTGIKADPIIINFPKLAG